MDEITAKIIAYMLLAVVIIVIVLNNATKKDTNVKIMDNNQDNKDNEKEINYKNYYRPKRYVITINELNFYNTLMEIAKELDLIVFSQVSLYNILQTKFNLDYKTKTICFNKEMSFHR